MADRIVGFSIKVSGVDATIKELSAVELELDAINKKLKEAKRLGDQDTYAKLRTDQENARKSAKDLNAELTNQKRRFDELNSAAGSFRQMAAELGRLRAEYRDLSAEDRKSTVGQNLIRNIQRLDAEVKKIDYSLGSFQRNVGNYRSAFDGIAQGLVRLGGITGIGLGISEATAATIEYSRAFADLAAILGVTGAEAKQLETIIGDLSVITLEGGETIVNTYDEIATALKLVGSNAPELLKNKEALAAVTKEALILAKASGEGLEPSAKALTVTMNQFGLAATDAKSIINALAAGSVAGSVEIPGITEALGKFGATAKGANVSLEESVALIETMGEAGIPLDVTGTSLRNILLSLTAADALPKRALKAFQEAGVSIEVLTNNTLPLGVRLKEISKISGDAGQLLEVFGKENINAAQALLDNLPTYEKYTAAVTGTNAAYQAAAINADSFAQDVENLKNILTNLATGLVGIVVPALSALVMLVEKFGPNLAAAALALGLYQAQLALTAYNAGLAAAGMAEMTLAQLALNQVTAAFNLLAKASPYILIAGAVFAAVEAIKYFIAEQEKLTDVVEQTNAALDEGIKTYAQEANSINALFSVLQSETASREEKQKAIDKLQKTYPEYLKNIDLEKASSTQLKEINDKLNSSILDRVVLQIQENEAKRIGNELAQAELELAKAREQQRKFADDTFIQGQTGTILPGRSLSSANAQAAQAQGKIRELQDGLNRLAGIGQELRKTLAQVDLSTFGVAESSTVAATATDQLTEAQRKEAEQAAKAAAAQEKANAAREKAAAKEKEQTITLQGLREELFKVQDQIDKFSRPELIPKSLLDQFDNIKKKIREVEEQLARLTKDPEDLGGKPKGPDITPTVDIEALKKQLDEENQLTRDAAEASLGITRDVEAAKLQAALDAIDQEQAARDKAAEHQRLLQQDIFDYLRQGIDAVQNIANVAGDNQIAAVEARYQRELELAQGNAQQIEQAERRKAEAIEAIQIKQARVQKSIAIATALMNAAVAIVNILAEPPTDPFGITKGVRIAFTSALAAVEIATIAATQFAEGGVLPSGDGEVIGQSHENGGVKFRSGNRNLEVEGGEWMAQAEDGSKVVINKHSTRMHKNLLRQTRGAMFPGKKALLSSINQSNGFGKAFAQGGVIQPAPSVPLNAPMVSSSQSALAVSELVAQSQALYENNALLAELIVATNNRIDNLTVYTDPTDIYQKGKAGETLKLTRQL